jgi:hypothetical protein
MSSIITSDSEMSENNYTMEISFESLPEPILHEIVAIIGSKSVADLHNVKMSSKFHGELTNDNYVLKKVSFEILVRSNGDQIKIHWHF